MKFEVVQKHNADGAPNPRFKGTDGYAPHNELHAVHTDKDGTEVRKRVIGADRSGSLPAVAEFMNAPQSLKAARMIINLQLNEVTSFMNALSSAQAALRGSTGAPSSEEFDSLAVLPVEPTSNSVGYCTDHDSTLPLGVDSRTSWVLMVGREVTEARGQ